MRRSYDIYSAVCGIPHCAYVVFAVKLVGNYYLRLHCPYRACNGVFLIVTTNNVNFVAEIEPVARTVNRCYFIAFIEYKDIVYTPVA